MLETGEVAMMRKAAHDSHETGFREKCLSFCLTPCFD